MRIAARVLTRGQAGVMGVGLLAVAIVSGSFVPATAEAQQAGTCVSAVQGEIAWNYEGNTRWAARNVRQLCEGAENSREPARCFDRVMHGGVDWGGGTRWNWRNALDLCGGSRDADATVRCFQSRVDDVGWQEAIQACQRNAGEVGGGIDPDPQIPVTDIDLSRVAGSGGGLARVQVSPGAVADAISPSNIRELVGLRAVSPSDLKEIEPADIDFHRAAEAPPKLSWAARMNLLEQADVPFEPLPEPPSEFTLSPRNHYVRGVGYLQFENAADVDPLSDRALMPSDARGAIELHFQAREPGRYLLAFRVSARREVTYAMWVGRDNPRYTRDAGSHNIVFVMETEEPGDVSSLFYSRDAAFTFHDVTVTRVE